MEFKKKEIKSKKLLLKLEIELNNSSLTDQEAANRIQMLVDSFNAKAFSEFIVFLLRETRSSTWELKNLEINSLEAQDASPQT